MDPPLQKLIKALETTKERSWPDVVLKPCISVLELFGDLEKMVFSTKTLIMKLEDAVKSMFVFMGFAISHATDGDGDGDEDVVPSLKCTMQQSSINKWKRMCSDLCFEMGERGVDPELGNYTCSMIMCMFIVECMDVDYVPCGKISSSLRTTIIDPELNSITLGYEVSMRTRAIDAKNVTPNGGFAFTVVNTMGTDESQLILEIIKESPKLIRDDIPFDAPEAAELATLDYRHRERGYHFIPSALLGPRIHMQKIGQTIVYIIWHTDTLVMTTITRAEKHKIYIEDIQYTTMESCVDDCLPALDEQQ